MALTFWKKRFMRQRNCVCGKLISLNRQLCGECLEVYGTNQSEWPEWLRWQVNDIQRDINYERRHDEFWLDDEDELRPDFAEPLHGCRIETHLHEDRNKC
jgi:hypothetical protein